jgi:hypothetical protein
MGVPDVVKYVQYTQGNIHKLGAKKYSWTLTTPRQTFPFSSTKLAHIYLFWRGNTRDEVGKTVSCWLNGQDESINQFSDST